MTYQATHGKHQVWIDAQHGDLRLVRYVTGEYRIEDQVRGLCSAWLGSQRDDRAEIVANPSIMDDYELDNSLTEE